MCPELSRMLWLEMIPQGNAADSDEHPTDDRDRARTFVQGLCRMLIESCVRYNDFCRNGMHNGEPVNRPFRDAEISVSRQNESLSACLQLRLSMGTIIFPCRARASEESCLWINLQN